MLVGVAGGGLFRLRRGPHVARASVEDHDLARLREATPCLARRLSGSFPDARPPRCDPLPPNDVMRHRQAMRPGGDVDPIHPPMKAPGCASATHGLPSCRNHTDPRPESAHVPDEAGLPALATRCSVRSIDVGRDQRPHQRIPPGGLATPTVTRRVLEPHRSTSTSSPSASTAAAPRWPPSRPCSACKPNNRQPHIGYRQTPAAHTGTADLTG